jgi:phosphatidylserine/phosphatidylglycerophosphate/cardiolipin synthase-like enzyme
LPAIYNADLARKLQSIVRGAQGKISWEALGWSIETSHLLYEKWRTSNSVELLWAGPCPSGQIAARRIDQVLYDLISESKRDVLLIAFAAYKIQRLNDALADAIRRGVSVRMILEFEGESEQAALVRCDKRIPTATALRRRRVLLAYRKQRTE